MNERKSTIINQQFRKFLLPTILITVTTNMSLMVDGIIVGNLLGSDALAAVNLVYPVILLLNAVYFLFGIGGSSLFAIAIGEGNWNKGREVFTLSILCIVVLGIVLCGLGFAVEPVLTNLLAKSSPALGNLVSHYLKATLLATPLLLLTSGVTYFLNTLSKTTISSVIMILANVVNLTMDYVLIKILDFGIAGAGLATGIGYLLGFLIAVFVCRNTKELTLCKISRQSLGMVSESIKLGISSTLIAISEAIQGVCINILFLSYLGTLGITALSVCISTFSAIAMFSMGAAATMLPFLGILYGEKDFAGIRFTIKNALLTTLVPITIFLLVVEFVPAQITTLFGIIEPEAMKVTVFALRIYVLSLPGASFLFVAFQIYQLLGHEKLATILVILGSFLVPILLVWALAVIGGNSAIWWAFFMTSLVILGVLLASIKYIRKKNPHLQGFFLLNTGEPVQTLDVTMIQNNTQAVALATQAIDYCKENGISNTLANRVGIALEEMTINTIAQNPAHQKECYIDVRLVLSKEEIRIAFKDNGIPYNPLTERNAEIPFDNIQVAIAMSSEICYDHVLGMNRTIIKINRT